MNRPLADEIRPKTLDEVVGQRHLLAPGAVLRRLIEKGTDANMVFYGPSGTGKTTIANIIAEKTNKTLYRLNATTASLQDIKDIMADVGTLMAPGGVLLYLDEIQYFNKKQQQSLLEFMENGKLTLIASTTENPYFYVYSALLSRSTVFEFKAVTAEEVEPAVLRALNIEKERSPLPLEWEEGVPMQIATACGGDVRKAINAVELLCQAAVPQKGTLRLTKEEASQIAQRSAMRYDRDGDAHYDILSALQKSIRGSDPDAAVHYLGRLLEAGDLLSPCRRLLVIAAEDVGLAYPMAIAITKACVDAALQVGLPEARLPLAEAAILLATAPKSNTAHNAIIAAMDDLKKGKSGDIPRCLQNVHADTTGFDNQQHYLYPHVFPNRWVEQQYLPDALKDVKYYEWGDNKTEQAAKAYWEKIKGKAL
ncbi:replication-associated recombination protein A [Oscillibacter valericigenes]|uniref:replication-associated recombination protein A n=1 Tax=Oscillibacter valericigenes TaxID=351091 RepID=UPI001F3214D2|nr:replication-associated recombination protein A [Oscillibacter valericigenes]MCF2616861.1 replication-associated recombination protein A [Oscillibacter valericigenes]